MWNFNTFFFFFFYKLQSSKQINLYFHIFLFSDNGLTKMNEEQKKTFENTSSSYLSLKAELLRKKQDVQKGSSTSASSSTILDNLQSSSSSLKLKPSTDLDIEVANPSKKKKKTEPAVATPSVPTASREDEIAFAKSRAILEAKAKLYEEIMSNGDKRILAEDDGDDEDNDKSFLVDFERKIYETNQTNNKIEYTDSFGRTRLVTPEEYERLKPSEKQKSNEKLTTNSTENEINRVERLHREQMRSKWEAEMEELRHKTHVHYQDLLFDEKREHGVGFYKFSTDDQQRAEQMTTLNELRTNTKIEQSKFLNEKEKRQTMMSDRLNKIRLRKAKELGIDLSDNPKESNTISEEQIPVNVKVNSTILKIQDFYLLM